MTVLVDTSVLIDYLRGHQGAAGLLEQERAAAPLHASEITRVEILAGMRSAEEDGTRSLPVDPRLASGRRGGGRGSWLAGPSVASQPSHHRQR